MRTLTNSNIYNVWYRYSFFKYDIATADNSIVDVAIPSFPTGMELLSPDYVWFMSPSNENPHNLMVHLFNFTSTSFVWSNYMVCPVASWSPNFGAIRYNAGRGVFHVMTIFNNYLFIFNIGNCYF